jgi:hypothetical protein
VLTKEAHRPGRQTLRQAIDFTHHSNPGITTMAVVISSETLHAAHLTATELKQELAVLLFQQHWTPRLAACMREKPKSSCP